MSDERTPDGSHKLNISDALEYLINIPDGVDITLIGGQSLCFHFYRYAQHFPQFKSGGWATTTKDIDFLGTRKQVQACADAWDGTAQYPSRWDTATPNTGIVIIHKDQNDDDIEIDFLAHVHGLKDREVKKDRAEANVEGRKFYCLSEFLCLQSRVCNVIDLPTKRDEHSIMQVVTAIEIMKCRIITLLDHSNEEVARKEAERVFKLARNKYGRRLFFEYEIDIFEAIPIDGRFCQKFKEKRYPQMKMMLETRREKWQRHLDIRKQQKGIR